MNTKPFMNAARNGNLHVMERLMTFPAVFAHAEMHTREFGHYVHPFVNRTLLNLEVDRRLFQSVQGHPLLILLTKDTIYQEVRDVVRDHFINRINDENCHELHQTWQTIIDGDSNAN